MKLTGFEPVATPHARVLILGTMPGRESLRVREYYANPGNSFWSIMGDLFGFPHESPYSVQIERLKTEDIALWDVLQVCEREGSLDSNIVLGNAEPNDFETFFVEHPRIRRICFNGQKTAELFRRLVSPKVPAVERYELVVLPSTSPANTHLGHEQKVSQWKMVKQGIE